MNGAAVGREEGGKAQEKPGTPPEAEGEANGIVGKSWRRTSGPVIMPSTVYTLCKEAGVFVIFEAAS